MKTIFLALNSKFSHTLLAPRYLVANCKHPVEIIETNVNVRLMDTLNELYSKKPDILAISCYIFNISYVKELLNEIKLLLPNIIIILGGYEVSYNPQDYINQCDYVMQGEGDIAFGQLIDDIINNQDLPQVINGGVVCNLDDIVSPYNTEYCSMGNNRILYYESSRGCPFGCTYCMSGSAGKVRAFSLPRVFADLELIISHKPNLIKFVDRTFNYDLKRTKTILQYLLDNHSQSGVKFHFEMAPNIFDEELFLLLESAPKDLFQLEIGIQSYNKTTLNAICRPANIQLINSNLSRLALNKNVHTHTDLIAGLPYEDYDSFVQGFDTLYSIGCDCLQLGFLKLLKGSQLHSDSDGYLTFSHPPYEIIHTPWLSYDQILLLKQAEEMLDLYHNSGRFASAIKFLVPTYCSPYGFYLQLSNYLKSIGMEKKGSSAVTQCDALFNFSTQNLTTNMTADQKLNFCTTLMELINNDYINSGNLRKWKRHLN